MMWKGIEGDSGLYTTSFGQGRWAAQQRIEGVGSSEGPALASTTPVSDASGVTSTPALFAAWKGISGDGALYWSSGLRGQQRVGGVGTSRGPALAGQLNRYVVMAWKGAGSDSGIYWSYLGLGPGEGRWAPQANVAGVGTSDRPALAYSHPRVVMAWKGIRGDSGIYVASQEGAGWTPQRRVPGVGTSAGPALAYLRGTLHMAWKGAGNDSGIYFAQSRDHGVTWTAQRRIDGVGTSHSPALAVYEGRLYLAWKGIPGDSGIYWSSGDGSNWLPQARVPNVGTSHGPALAGL